MKTWSFKTTKWWAGDGGNSSDAGSDLSPPPPPILPSPGGLPSPPIFLTESFPSLDYLFDGENNELQTLQLQAVAVPVAALQPRITQKNSRQIPSPL